MGSYVGVQKIAAKRIGVTYEVYLQKIKTHKWCYKCKIWQERQLFNIDNHRGDHLSSRCVNCTRVKNPTYNKGRVSTFKGKKHTKETKARLSAAKKGKPSPMKGKKHSIETRIKISKALRKNAKKGKESHSYKDGKLVERRGQRFSMEYKRWRFDVYSRDKFTCQNCGDNRGGNLNAHHIKHFATHPNLRFEISNGITLCESCHEKEHSK